MATIEIILLVLNIAVTGYGAFLSRKVCQRIVTPSNARITNLCTAIEKNELGEWKQVGRKVRVGSRDYLEAVNTPGIALRHLSGEIEEGVQ